MLDVTTSLGTWANTPTENRGWIFRPTGTSPVRGRSSEYGTISLRPQLSVTYQIATSDPTLMVTLAGSGSGTVIDGETLTCPSSCSATYPLGSSVTLQATADPGSIFTGWSGGGCTGTGSCLVTMDQAQQVTGTFEGPQTLTVTLGGSGSGTVTDGGALTCPTSCTADYNYNTSVTITATADPGSVFTGWSGAGCTSTGSCLVTMDQAQQVTATFELDAPPPASVTLTFRNGENGYTGTQDAFIRGSNPDTPRGKASLLTWTTKGDKSALVQFDNVFGNGPDQVPIGATITSATLTLEVYDDGIAAEVYEVAVDWTEDETFNSFGGEPDVQADELGPLVSAPGGTVPTGTLMLDVTSSLSTWANNPTANRGWIFRPTGATPVRARSSEYSIISLRPLLSVTYVP